MFNSQKKEAIRLVSQINGHGHRNKKTDGSVSHQFKI
ncbi:hypothetical protein A33I_14855 [Alkalihalophilus marmarensis DSM 21297]|uniref:Uncharacterized protein n=1 Tax=Alkalihalophilus marmarensis DSM 21297 TaxID=1188261 RepID=U6SP64_9BACI|nr:hypothetical protein A33I_14855 [Alkalihalophilus marmarensis DSM 21297]